MLSSLQFFLVSCILMFCESGLFLESRSFLKSRLFLESRLLLEIGETIDHIYHYEMHPICSLQRHDRLTNGVTITQALRCQVDKWLMGALRE